MKIRELELWKSQPQPLLICSEKNTLRAKGLGFGWKFLLSEGSSTRVKSQTNKKYTPMIGSTFLSPFCCRQTEKVAKASFNAWVMTSIEDSSSKGVMLSRLDSAGLTSSSSREASSTAATMNWSEGYCTDGLPFHVSSCTSLNIRLSSKKEISLSWDYFQKWQSCKLRCIYDSTWMSHSLSKGPVIVSISYQSQFEATPLAPQGSETSAAEIFHVRSV